MINRDYLRWIENKPKSREDLLNACVFIVVASILGWSIIGFYALKAQKATQQPLGRISKQIASGETWGQLNAAEQAELGIIRLSKEKVASMRLEASNDH